MGRKVLWAICITGHFNWFRWSCGPFGLRATLTGSGGPVGHLYHGPLFNWFRRSGGPFVPLVTL